MYLTTLFVLTALNVIAAHARSVRVPLRTVQRAADSVLSQPSSLNGEIAADSRLRSQYFLGSDLDNKYVYSALHRRRKFADTRVSPA
jgi:hypothetical protein